MDRKPKVIKKDEARKRQEEGDRSIEVNFMLLLIRKYPDKARDAIQKIFVDKHNCVSI
jgi:hypothetical protein